MAIKLRHTLRSTIKHRRLIHRRLLRRLILFPIIAFGLLIFVTIDAITDGVSPLWILVGGLLGLGIGYLVGQIYKIYWKDDDQKIVSGIDRMTVILLIAYVLVRMASEKLAGEFIHGNELTIVTYSFIGGLLLGRMLGVLRKVNRILESKTVLDHIKSMPRKKHRG